MSQLAITRGYQPRSVVNAAEHHSDFLRRRTSEVLSQNGGRLISFDLRTLNGTITVTLRFVGLREMVQNHHFVFAPSNLSKERIMFVGRDKNEFRFSYSTTCQVDQIFDEIIKEVRKQTNGSKNEHLALGWFKRLVAKDTIIKDARLTDKSDDLAGVDLFVKVRLPYQRPIKVPIQIKSHGADQWKHRLNPRRWHVPSMLVDQRTTFEGIEEQMKNLLLSYVKDKRVMHISRFGSWLGVFAP